MHTTQHSRHPHFHPMAHYLPAMGWGKNDNVTVFKDDANSPHIVNKPWILCIDDDQEFSHGLKLKLQSRGYEVVRAFAGMDGYRYAFEFEPSAILLDLHLPNVSGEEVLSQLRYHPSTSHIPVVIVTGLNEQGLDQKMRSLGARDFFRKPVSYSQLVDAVDRYSNEQHQVKH